MAAMCTGKIAVIGFSVGQLFIEKMTTARGFKIEGEWYPFPADKKVADTLGNLEGDFVVGGHPIRDLLPAQFLAKANMPAAPDNIQRVVAAKNVFKVRRTRRPRPRTRPRPTASQSDSDDPDPGPELRQAPKRRRRSSARPKISVTVRQAPLTAIDEALRECRARAAAGAERRRLDTNREVDPCVQAANDLGDVLNFCRTKKVLAERRRLRKLLGTTPTPKGSSPSA